MRTANKAGVDERLSLDKELVSENNSPTVSSIKTLTYIPPAQSKKVKTSGRSPSIVRRHNPTVRVNENGGFEFEIEPGKWIRAVYHSSMREEMYHNFCPWKREEEALFPWQQGNPELWDLTSNDKDHYYLAENGQNLDEDPAMSEVREMTWDDGKTIVLASDNQPILDFPHLPATISSRISGREIQLLELMDKRVKIEDLMDRMPKETDGRNGARVPVTAGMLQKRRNIFRYRLEKKAEKAVKQAKEVTAEPRGATGVYAPTSRLQPRLPRGSERT
ncbi:MAG: hypothetical protein Q9221_006351 [Calogaya cf. arnoldii]